MNPRARLAAGIAHDFNNLLTVLAGNLELILQSASDDRIRGLARPALEAAETGAFLNRRLLSLGRRRRTSVRPINLNDRISETFGLIQRAVGQQISIQLDLAAELWLAVADPAEIDSAVLNLVLNSRDAMPRGGEIRIQTRNQRIEETLAHFSAGSTGGRLCLPRRGRQRRGNDRKMFFGAPSILSSQPNRKGTAPVSD